MLSLSFRVSSIDFQQSQKRFLSETSAFSIPLTQCFQFESVVVIFFFSYSVAFCRLLKHFCKYQGVFYHGNLTRCYNCGYYVMSVVTNTV